MGSILGIFQGNLVCDSALEVAQRFVLFQRLLEPGLVIRIGVVVIVEGGCRMPSFGFLPKRLKSVMQRCPGGQRRRDTTLPVGHARPLPCFKFKITMGENQCSLSPPMGSIGPNTNERKS